MRQIILLALAVVAGIIAFFSSKTYLENQERKLKEGYQEVAVIVAKVDIPVGTKITEDVLAVAKMVGSPAVRSAIGATDRNFIAIKGLPVARHIKQGEPLFWVDVPTSTSAEYGLSSMLSRGETNVDPRTFKRTQTIGMRAISIPVDLVASVTQMVLPGDRVDLIGTFTFPSSKPDPTLDTVTVTILQDVLVMATGKTTTRDLMSPAFIAQSRGPSALTYSTVTLEVTPQEAEILAFAIRRGGGNLMLALRNREDTTIIWKPQTINFEYLEKHIKDLNWDRQRRRGRVPPDVENN